MSEPKLWDPGFIMMIVLSVMAILMFVTPKIIKLFPKQQGGGSENTKTNIVLAFISVFIIYKIFSSYY